MYKKVLIPLENSATDEVILRHIKELNRSLHAELILVHVADGFVARNQSRLNLAESEEMREDREYLKKQVESLAAAGCTARAVLVCGEPAEEILRVAEEERPDLIAMATHGHRALGDFVLGSVAESIRHRTTVPVLMLKAG